MHHGNELDDPTATARLALASEDREYWLAHPELQGIVAHFTAKGETQPIASDTRTTGKKYIQSDCFNTDRMTSGRSPGKLSAIATSRIKWNRRSRGTEDGSATSSSYRRRPEHQLVVELGKTTARRGEPERKSARQTKPPEEKAQEEGGHHHQ